MSEIAEIRARHEAGERASAAADREWLLAEVERLTRERDESRADQQIALAEVERLLAEVDRLCHVADWIRRQRRSAPGA